MSKNSIWDRTFTDMTDQVSVDENDNTDSHHAQQPYEAKQLSPDKPAKQQDSRTEEARAQERADFEAWQQSKSASQRQRRDDDLYADVGRGYRSSKTRYNQRREPLPGQKTYLGASAWIGFGLLSMAGVTIPGVEMDTGESLRMIWEGAMFIFARLGISKSKND